MNDVRTTIFDDKSVGMIRRVHKGSKFSFDISPDEWLKLKDIESGHFAAFTAMDGRSWEAKRVGMSLRFSSGGMRCIVPISFLAPRAV